MSDWYYGNRARPNRLTTPTLWAIVLSLLLHGLILWQWHTRMPDPAADPNATRGDGAPLAVKLAPPTPAPSLSAPASPPPPPPRQRAAPPRPPVIARLPPPVPPVMTMETPAPVIVPPPAPEPPVAAPVAPSPVPPPAPTPIEGDLSSYMAARRRARGEAEAPPSPAESEKARRDAIVASNLASLNVTAAGAMRNAGGLFSIRRVTEDEAEFLFFGWSNEARRRQAQAIVVKRGSAPTIQTAVVQKMIAIIRDDVNGEFTFRSARTGRDVQLSSRLEDNAALEAFMLREFFDVVERGR